MKKKQRSPGADTGKNEIINKPAQKAKSKTANEPKEDLGTMKIGKAHSMNDDQVSISSKEKR